MEIKFGTDGWRGIIGYDFTAKNVVTVAQALADYMLSLEPNPTCVIGFDTRFMSDIFAQEAAQVLAGNGIRALLTEKAVTSPVLSFSTKHLRATGGVMITASHNPPIYNGIKFKGPYGGSALPEVVQAIENKLFLNKSKKACPTSPLIEKINPDEEYLNHLSSLVDLEKILFSGLTVAVDTMYGSGRGYFTKLFGDSPIITELQTENNPSFNGINPEPIGKNLNRLSKLVRNTSNSAGIALDGDGDRIGVICSNGSFMNSHQIFALLLKYLVEYRNLKGGVVKTFSTSIMIDRLAELYNLPLYETPIGFKYICDLFLAEDILMGGEESGGIGFKFHLPERDGILCGLLLMEFMAETGLTPEALLEDISLQTGHFSYDRKDLPVPPSAKAKFYTEIAARTPAFIANHKVAKVKDLDGLKFYFEEGGWLLFRFSGTEPLLRLYAEAGNHETVASLLAAGETLVNL